VSQVYPVAQHYTIRQN